MIEVISSFIILLNREVRCKA